MSSQLPKDLQELVLANIITAETAEQILHWYQRKEEKTPNKLTIVLGILGVLLVSLGLILLIAHNWDDLNKLTKTIMAFLPLLVGQAFCIYTLARKKDNVLWRESSASFLFLAIPSCIALISQIYNISGTLSEFLFTWLLLAAPLIYILRSSVCSLLFIAVATWYACNIGYSGIFSSYHTVMPYWYIIFLIFLVPHYYRYLKYNRDSNFFHLLNWFLAISLTITLGTFVDRKYDFPEWVLPAYLGMFCLFYLSGKSGYFRNNRLFANPLLVIGILGILVVLFICTFDWTWREISPSHETDFFGWIFSYVVIALLAANILALVPVFRTSSLSNSDPAGFSGIVLAIMVILARVNPNISQLVINLWLLVLALYFIKKGSRLNHFGILNFGLLIIATLAITRFFDDSISFIWRGLFFVITGVGFFAANYLLIKKRKAIISKDGTI